MNRELQRAYDSQLPRDEDPLWEEFMGWVEADRKRYEFHVAQWVEMKLERENACWEHLFDLWVKEEV